MLFNKRKELEEEYKKWLEQESVKIEDCALSVITFLSSNNLIDEYKAEEFLKPIEDKIIEEVLYRFDFYSSKREKLDPDVETISFYFNNKEFVVLKEDEGIILSLHKLLKGKEYE